MIIKFSEELLYQSKLKESVRLIGITISNLNSKEKNKLKNKKINYQLKIEF